MSANILTPEERQRLTTIPTEINQDDLIRFFSLAPTDLAILDRRRQPSHQLDQAAHVCVLRWLGWSPVVIDQLPRHACLALSHQLHLPVVETITEPPPSRSSRRHAARAQKHLGWRKYTQAKRQALLDWLQPLAEEHDHGLGLLEALCEHLYREKIVRPGLAHLERLVETARNLARERIAQAINSQLSPTQKQQLDDLLKVPSGESRSLLQRLKETPASASGNELLVALQEVELIRGLGIDQLDLSAGKIHPNRVKLLARRAKQRTNWLTTKLQPTNRYPLLVCFLDQSQRDWTDMAVRRHGDLLAHIFKRAKDRRDDEVKAQGKRLNPKVLLLGQLGRVILDEAIPDLDLRPAIYRLIPRDTLASTVRECDELAQPADDAPFSFARRAYRYLRRFGPRFLKSIALEAAEKDEPLLEAVEYMRRVNEGRQPFGQPPLKFVPHGWKPYVIGVEGKVDRPMYELCLHDCLAKGLDRGALWVPGSRSYTRLQDDWISDADWPAARAKFLALYPHLADVEAFLKQAQESLDQQMAEANRVWPDLQDEVWIENDVLHLHRDEARELPPGTARLQKRLTDLLPRVGIAQLLLEANHWIGVEEHLTNLYAQEKPVKNLTAKKIAVLMAEGLNLGLQNMSYCVSDMTYADLAGVKDRYFREDTLRQATAAVVNFYVQNFPLIYHWGDGTKSSSDGQTFGVPVKTIYSQYHPESPSKSGRALAAYTHISDFVMPFYTQIIHQLSQEGAQVLDGLLHHETDLTPHHHYVDSGGYQDTLWGACHLLGFSLEPRIRDIGDMRLFRMRRSVDEHQHIRSLFTDPINTRAVRENWDNQLRLMASIRFGVVPAALVLRKLDAYHTESGLYKALRETGRIARTAFLLRYFTRKEVRREVQMGLNKQEGVHSLVRKLAVGHSGEFRVRDLEGQLNRATCIHLVTAMVITWNTAYLTAAVEKLRAGGVEVKPDQLAHVWPVMSEHINRLGRYEFDPAAPAVQTSIRTLKLRTDEEIAEQLGLGI